MTVEVRPIGIEEIDKRLLNFEQNFELPSAMFLTAFQNGHLDETDEFREWSMLIAARRLLVAG